MEDLKLVAAILLIILSIALAGGAVCITFFFVAAAGLHNHYGLFCSADSFLFYSVALLLFSFSSLSMIFTWERLLRFYDVCRSLWRFYFHGTTVIFIFFLVMFLIELCSKRPNIKSRDVISLLYLLVVHTAGQFFLSKRPKQVKV